MCEGSWGHFFVHQSIIFQLPSDMDTRPLVLLKIGTAVLAAEHDWAANPSNMADWKHAVDGGSPAKMLS